MPAASRTLEAPEAEPIKPQVKKRAPPKRSTKKLMVMIRRQGGARIMTIPPAVLASLGADEGTELVIDVKGGKLVAEPVAPELEPAPVPRRRYTLDELLQGAEYLPALYASVSGALNGEPVGNEIG